MTEPIPGLDDALFDATEDERLVAWLVHRQGLDQDAAREEVAALRAPADAGTSLSRRWAVTPLPDRKPTWWAGLWPPLRQQLPDGRWVNRS